MFWKVLKGNSVFRLFIEQIEDKKEPPLCRFHEKIDDVGKMGDALAYIMKYIEKSGERIVYSKGLPQYFISDIMDEDIICHLGDEHEKLLLADDFGCWDEGRRLQSRDRTAPQMQLKTKNS